MRTITPALALHLEEGTTTLCRTWTLLRRDRTVLGFTDHDRDLAVEGVVHRARTGLTAAEFTAELGFPVGGGDVSGALSSDAIQEADIAAGLYDDATVLVRHVNWQDPAQHVLLLTASLGEIRREDGAFVAELRGPTHRLDEEGGLVFRATCSADLGDARCRVDLAGSPFAATATIVSTDGALTVRTGDLGGHPDGWFTAGRLLWLSGANTGWAVEVKLHALNGALAVLELWQRAPRPIAPGDVVRITAGCDKRLATCRDRFGNVANFRGFPHMPGNDFVVRSVSDGEPGLDGGSLFR